MGPALRLSLELCVCVCTDGSRGYTHIIGNGELMSAGRWAGIQTWAHQGNMIRLEEKQFTATARLGPYFLGLAEVKISTV